MRSWCWRLGAVGGITLAGCSILGSTAGESCHGGSNCCRVALQEVPQSRGRAGGGGGIAPQGFWLLGEVTFGRMAAMLASIRPLTCQAFSDPAASL